MININHIVLRERCYIKVGLASKGGEILWQHEQHCRRRGMLVMGGHLSWCFAYVKLTNDSPYTCGGCFGLTERGMGQQWNIINKDVVFIKRLLGCMILMLCWRPADLYRPAKLAIYPSRAGKTLDAIIPLHYANPDIAAAQDVTQPIRGFQCCECEGGLLLPVVRHGRTLSWIPA